MIVILVIKSVILKLFSSAEQITVEENLRAQDSNSLPVDKEQVTKSTKN